MTESPICKFSDHALLRLKERFDISPYILSDLIDNKKEAFDLASNIDNSLIRAVPLPEKQTHIIVVQDEKTGLIKTIWTPFIFEKLTGLKFRLPSTRKALYSKNDRPMIKLKIELDGEIREIPIGSCPAFVFKSFDGAFDKMISSEIFEKWLLKCCAKNRILRTDILDIIVEH